MNDVVATITFIYLSEEDKECEKLDGPEKHPKETKVTERPRLHHFLAFLRRQFGVAAEEGEPCREARHATQHQCAKPCGQHP